MTRIPVFIRVHPWFNSKLRILVVLVSLVVNSFLVLGSCFFVLGSWCLCVLVVNPDSLGVLGALAVRVRIPVFICVHPWFQTLSAS